jgi:hypothetical protein
MGEKKMGEHHLGAVYRKLAESRIATSVLEMDPGRGELPGASKDESETFLRRAVETAARQEVDVRNEEPKPQEGRLAVIGTAGRQDDADKVSPALWDAMYLRTLGAMSDWGIRDAVSGGAAWADHLAVRAFMDGHVESLILFLPAKFERARFVPDASVRFNPGRTCNGYHEAFSRCLGFDSLGEIEKARERGARLVVEPGFHQRNLKVAAAATHVLAMTFGNMRPPVDLLPDSPGFTKAPMAGLKDGGTAHTWDNSWKCVAKRHVSLNWLLGEMVPAPRP